MNKTDSKIFCGTTKFTYFDESISDKKSPTIKLFKIEISKYNAIVNDLLTILTQLEVDKAQRFLRDKDRNRFIICRSLLKYLLAKETGLDVLKVQFELNNSQKPYFSFDKSVFFNLSHASNYAVIGVGDYELGVDIEYINPDFDFSEIQSSVFNQTENDFINNSNNGPYAFYKFWTRKEAIVKAIGKGIDEGFSEISVMDGFHSIKSSIVSNFENINVYSFDLNDNYVGALALTEVATNFDVIRFYPIPTPEELKELIS